jgi:hydroxypyruvate isomerase
LSAVPNFAANLSMMFTEVAFLDRFEAAAQAGFSAVEYLFPYDHSPDEIARRLERHQLTQALFNMPPGDFSKGERGLAALPDRFDEFKRGVTRALDYADATGVKRIHMMAGLIDARDGAAHDSYRRAIDHAASALDARGINLLLEPINPRNMPGYFLCDFEQGGAVRARRERAERAAAIRYLSSPDHPWRRHDGPAPLRRHHRPCPDRLRPLAA